MKDQLPLAITVNDKQYQPQVIFSRRKTAAIEIRNGQLVVRVPTRTSRQWIISFIESRKSWIDKHLTTQIMHINNHLPDPIPQGSIEVRGKPIALDVFLNRPQSEVCFVSQRLELHIGQRTRRDATEIAEELLKGWLFAQADQFFQQRTRFWAQQMQLTPTKVKTASFKRMWGRCSSKGEVALNWKLIMAPDSAIDYVIIHELAHLAEFNHSPAFWAIVGSVCPDYRVWKRFFQERAAWLVW